MSTTTTTTLRLLPLLLRGRKFAAASAVASARPFFFKTLSSSSLSSFSFYRVSEFNPHSTLIFRAQTSSYYFKKMYSTVVRGTPNTTDYRRFFKNADGVPISPMHDIPMMHDEKKGIYNVVIEVPRWTNAKMEINLKEALNPIKQDVKKGKLRFVANCFPHKGYIWNYGFIPQTWEDPEFKDESTECKGDGDPIDVCEIGQKVHAQGEVVKVKVLGTVALIDEGETDWKVLAIDVTDPLADKLNDVEDIEKHMPGFLAATVEWFKIYKMPDGKPANKFAFNGEAKNREFAVKVIKEVNTQWKKLMEKEGKCELVDRKCTQVEGCHKISKEDAEAVISAAPALVSDPAPLPDHVDKWHYVKP